MCQLSYKISNILINERKSLSHSTDKYLSYLEVGSSKKLYLALIQHASLNGLMDLLNRHTLFEKKEEINEN